MLNCNNFLVREKRTKLSRREKDIYRAWLEGRYKKDHLKTISGKSVSIVSPGHRNELEGPDFSDAMVIIGDELLKGPIEIHLDNGNWYEHNHQNDPNYNDVILHVVTSDRNGKEIKTESNTNVPTLVLQNIDVPSDQKPFCKEWNDLDAESMLEILKRYGQQRFNRKSLLLKAEMMNQDYEQVFYAGIADVLGYSKNRVAFAKLVKYIPLQKVYGFIADLPRDRKIPAMEALFLGASGFLNSKNERFFLKKRYYEDIKALWKEIRSAYNFVEIEGLNWHFVKSRPANHPTVRILALVQIINNFAPEKPFELWLNFVSREPDTEALYDWLDKYFQNPAGLWRNHPLLHKQSRRKLIGKKRGMDLLSNYLLPFASAVGNLNTNQRLVNVAHQLSQEIEKGAVPGIVRRMFSNLGISTKLIDNNNLLQGGIEFYRNWCDMNLCQCCPVREYAN